MRHLQVRDVMTADPVTVTAGTSIKDLAGILVREKTSGVPVLSLQGEIVGVATERDLLKKEELHRDPHGHQWAHLSYRTRRAIAAAETAGDLMNTHPVTVGPEATVAAAARLMDRHQVTCLPVVDEHGKLLGVVSPRDLLRVFLRPDDEIRAEIVSQVLTGEFATNPALVQIEVTGGVVRMSGELERKSMLPLVLPLVRAIDGVIDAEGELTYAIDDTKLPRVPDMTEY
jgi:CBS domain-containing protein